MLDADDWPRELSDEQILECLLTLNLERAGQAGGVTPMGDRQVDPVGEE